MVRSHPWAVPAMSWRIRTAPISSSIRWKSICPTSLTLPLPFWCIHCWGHLDTPVLTGRLKTRSESLDKSQARLSKPIMFITTKSVVFLDSLPAPLVEAFFLGPIGWLSEFVGSFLLTDHLNLIASGCTELDVCLAYSFGLKVILNRGHYC